MKGLRIIKIVKEINFEEVWGELKAKKLCHETKYFRETLVFM